MKGKEKMRLGDIKIEALKIMFSNVYSNLSIEDLEDIREDNLNINDIEYLNGMPGAINRCFADLESRKILPERSYPLNKEYALASDYFLRWPLSGVPDFYDVSRIVKESGRIYSPSESYRREGGTLVLPNDKYSKYTLVYYPKIERITSATSNYYEPDIPDNIAAIIPYFIKAELYRDDEPNEAGEARNWYEAALLNVETSHGVGARVEDVYSLDEV